MLTPYLNYVAVFFQQIFYFETPYGIAFGAIVVGIFGAPLLVKAYKKFF